MKLPEITRKIGITDPARTVYIEDYVLQYLNLYRDKSRQSGNGQSGNSFEMQEENIILYGYVQEGKGCQSYIIREAACSTEDENARVEQAEQTEQTVVGTVHMEIWELQGNDLEGIFLGDEEQPIQGYYVFYEGSERMKARLCSCYEHHSHNKPESELVALSNHSSREERIPLLYLIIRMAAIGILILFCAIAVTSIDHFNKLSDFVQTAVHTEKMLEEP